MPSASPASPRYPLEESVATLKSDRMRCRADGASRGACPKVRTTRAAAPFPLSMSTRFGIACTVGGVADEQDLLAPRVDVSAMRTLRIESAYLSLVPTAARTVRKLGRASRFPGW